MNWTRNIGATTAENPSASVQFHEEKYSDMNNIQSLCNEIESLTSASVDLKRQYKSIIQYYQNLARKPLL